MNAMNAVWRHRAHAPLGADRRRQWTLGLYSFRTEHLEALLAARDAIEGQTEISPVDQADQLVVLCFLAEAEDVAAAAIKEYMLEEKLMQSTLYESILQKGYSKGEAKGEAKGLGKGQRVAVLDLCELLGIEVSSERRARLEAMDLDQLAALRTHLKAHRSWPGNL